MSVSVSDKHTTLKEIRKYVATWPYFIKISEGNYIIKSEIEQMVWNATPNEFHTFQIYLFSFCMYFVFISYF